VILFSEPVHSTGREKYSLILALSSNFQFHSAIFSAFIVATSVAPDLMSPTSFAGVQSMVIKNSSISTLREAVSGVAVKPT
jgi:hypothetical protein